MSKTSNVVMSELTSTAVSDFPAFVRLKDKYKQELNKAADLAARCEVLLTSHEPDAWKEPQELGYQYMGPGTKLKKTFGAWRSRH